LKIVESIDIILRRVVDSLLSKEDGHTVILVGGCSRAGKTTFSKQLAQKIDESGFDVLTVSIDSWLISIDDRIPNSTVVERYDTEGINRALSDLLNKKEVIPPIYDPVTRRRIKEFKGPSLKIQSGAIIIEGTITLALTKLLQKSDLNIFIQTSDITRLKRLIDFYSNNKGLSKNEYKKILLSRENEEIPFIKQSAENAHFIRQL
jgi:uridine kinase